MEREKIIIVQQGKNMVVALLLTFFFGPLGMLYSTVAGGIIMLIVSTIVGFITLGFGLIFIWPIQMIWAAVAVNRYNKKIREQTY